MDPNNFLIQTEMANTVYWLGMGTIFLCLLFGYYLGRRWGKPSSRPSLWMSLIGILVFSIVAGWLGSMSNYVVAFWMLISAAGGLYVGHRSSKQEKNHPSA